LKSIGKVFSDSYGDGSRAAPLCWLFRGATDLLL